MVLPITPPAEGKARGDARGRRWTSPAALAGLFVAALTVVLHRRVLLGGQAYYYRDIHLQWLPQAEAFVRCVRAGSWPLWNPYLSFGQALLANPNAQVLYPPTWLNLLMPPWTYYTLFVVVHFLLSGAGMIVLARRLGLSGAAAAASAAVWLASGPFLSLVSLWNHLAGAAWIPWCVWAADRALLSGRRRDAVPWAAAVAAPVLAGSPETTLMAALASVAIALRHRRAHAPRRLLGLATLAGALALGLSAAQWAPSLELARRSMRTALPELHVTLWSVPPIALVQCLAPALLDPLPLRAEVRTALFDGREPLLASLYLGLAASGLVLAALLEGRRLPRVLALLMAASALVALGRHSPVHHLLVSAVPPLRALRFPAKAMILVAFLWSLLAGFGLDALRRGAGWRSAAVRVWLSTAAFLSLAAAVLMGRFAPSWGRLLVETEFTLRSLPAVVAPVSQALYLSAAAAAALALLATPAARRAGRAWAALAVLVPAADLALAHRGLNPTADTELLRYRPPALGALLDRPPLSRVYSYDYFFPGKAERYLGHAGYLLKVPRDQWPAPWADAAALRAALYPSVLGYWGVETAYGIDALGLYTEPLAALTTLVRAEEETPGERRLLQMGAVSRVVALHLRGFEDLRPLAEVPGLLMEPLEVFAVPDAFPRAYAVEGVRVADRGEALRTLVDPAFDPRRSVVLPAGREVAPGEGFTSEVRVVEWRPDRAVVEAALGRAGHLVLVDAFDPAWRATVDGARAEVLRANLAFRAVALGPGRHRVALAYRPASVGLGLAASLLTLAAAALLRRARPRG